MADVRILSLPFSQHLVQYTEGKVTEWVNAGYRIVGSVIHPARPEPLIVYTLQKD